jgi:hypothetical protein
MRALLVDTGDKVQIADAMNGASSKSRLMPAWKIGTAIIRPGFRQQTIFAATPTGYDGWAVAAA